MSGRKGVFFFYLAIVGFILFELANVYFIMPLPGSQVSENISIAYFLHSYRWVFRFIFGLSILVYIHVAWKAFRPLTLFMMIVLGAVLYMTHQRMAADTMFYKPKVLRMADSSNNEVSEDKIVIGIVHQNEARAYPIQFLGYHHQVPDTIAGMPVMITYCTVCRSGRVFLPLVNGQQEIFRLVGMDHFNAMFEDQSSGTWWRQVTGEAVAGPHKGKFLPEWPSTQTSLRTWLSLYPNSLVMQPDSNFNQEYLDLADYETGERKGQLTKRDTASWKDKSWIAGMDINGMSKAYDWNELIRQRIINDTLNHLPVAIMITPDAKGILAFERLSVPQQLQYRHDTLTDGDVDYHLSGHPLDSMAPSLKPLQVYQEYWHSWRTFHPGTLH